jgi:hypothetical protein
MSPSPGARNPYNHGPSDPQFSCEDSMSWFKFLESHIGRQQRVILAMTAEALSVGRNACESLFVVGQCAKVDCRFAMKSSSITF